MKTAAGNGLIGRGTPEEPVQVPRHLRLALSATAGELRQATNEASSAQPQLANSGDPPQPERASCGGAHCEER